MKYENHIPPEGINSNQESPFKELPKLLGGMALFLVMAFAGLYLIVRILSENIPYQYEEQFAALLIEKITTHQPNAEDLKIQDYLQTLSDELARNMDLPSEMKITVHYSSKDTVNAFATLGGHVFMYKGLIEKLPNENALSMVLAHEIAHIKHRHPIAGMGQGLTILIALAGISSVTNETITSGISGFITLNSMRFSRQQETQSDESGLSALVKKYKHTQGADKLFEVFRALEKEGSKPQEFFSTHPLSQSRIDNIAHWTKNNGWNANGKTTPLPNFLIEAMN